MKDVDRAWLAGLYEGEGCCTVNPTSCYIFIKMTDEDVIEKAKSLFDCGSIYTIPTDGKRKAAYKWQFGKRHEVEKFIDLTVDFLGERRKKKFLEVEQFYIQRDKKKKQRSIS